MASATDPRADAVATRSRAVTRPGRRGDGGARPGGGAWLTLACLAFGLAGGACYNPRIDDGNLACAAGQCPDGFACLADNRCHHVGVTVDVGVPPSDAGAPGSDAADGPTPDANPPMCTTAVVTPVCQQAPAAGQACNPGCQKGCACGRCNIVDRSPQCVPVGSAKLGDTCKPGAQDNCGAGLICLSEGCGNGLGRCYRHCAGDEQCPGSICTIPILDQTGKDTGFRTCDVPAQSCDPVNNTGCPDPALACYLTSANQTLCDCANPHPADGGTSGGMNDAPCNVYNDCAAGFFCVDSGMGPRCHFVCLVASPACPAGRCIPSGTGSKYGYCGG
jgi:hypothetical protein